MDRPANQDVQQHREQDDGHGGGYGDQDNLAVLTGDGEGCWKDEKSRNSLLKQQWNTNDDILQHMEETNHRVVLIIIEVICRLQL